MTGPKGARPKVTQTGRQTPVAAAAGPGHGRKRRRDQAPPPPPAVSRVYFARGGTTPTGRSLDTVRTCADWLHANPDCRLHLLGHANARGLRAAQRALATERTRTVRDLLVWLGARRTQVRQSQPPRLHQVTAVSTRAERQRHRCVELIPVPDAPAAVGMALASPSGGGRSPASRARRPAVAA